MSIREEIPPYIDGNNLVAPNPVPPNTIVGSDNGTCFTSEYYVMLKKMGQLLGSDYTTFDKIISSCINNEGMLCRVPRGQTASQEEVDDYYGVMNGCMQMGNTSIPRQILMSLIKNMGFMDTVNPGSHSNWATFMPRQPQLMAAVVAASFPTWNPIHILIRLLCFPLFLVAAVTLAVSCVNTPIDQADPRRLSWHLLQTVCGVSLMCKLASFLWYKRLAKDYKGAGMKGVAYVYYSHDHPFIKYWVD